MTLRQKQVAFTKAVLQLMQWTFDQGWELTLGEVSRTKEQQQLYYNIGKTHTMQSKHLNRLAIDLNLFIDGKYQQSMEAYRPLGEYWIQLNPEHHVWGGNWPTLRDCVHFEYKD